MKIKPAASRRKIVVFDEIDIFLNDSGVDDLINEIFDEISLNDDNILDIIIDDDYESD